MKDLEGRINDNLMKEKKTREKKDFGRKKKYKEKTSKRREYFNKLKEKRKEKEEIHK